MNLRTWGGRGKLGQSESSINIYILPNWEIGIDIYTLICIKWITNKNLLYKKIHKI